MLLGAQTPRRWPRILHKVIKQRCEYSQLQCLSWNLHWYQEFTGLVNTGLKTQDRLKKLGKFDVSRSKQDHGRKMPIQPVKSCGDKPSNLNNQSKITATGAACRDLLACNSVIVWIVWELKVSWLEQFTLVDSMVLNSSRNTENWYSTCCASNLIIFNYLALARFASRFLQKHLDCNWTCQFNSSYKEVSSDVVGAEICSTSQPCPSMCDSCQFNGSPHYSIIKKTTSKIWASDLLPR